MHLLKMEIKGISPKTYAIRKSKTEKSEINIFLQPKHALFVLASVKHIQK